MFCNSNQKSSDKLNKLANLIYNKSRLGTEELYKLLNTNNEWQINNKTAFIVISFFYHFFYFRIVLLSKYSDDYISKVLFSCLNELISHITNDISEKNTLIDICNDTFTYLDYCIKQELLENKNTILDRAKFFVASVENCKSSEVNNSIAIMQISTYFASVLKDSSILN